MPKIEEKFTAVEFTVPTHLSFDEVLAAADVAAERAANLFVTVKREGIEGTEILYLVRNFARIKQGVFHVTYHEGEGGAPARVQISAPWYITQQSTVFFIPIGPKDSGALGPFRTFSKLLREASSPTRNPAPEH